MENKKILLEKLERLEQLESMRDDLYDYLNDLVYGDDRARNLDKCITATYTLMDLLKELR